MSSTSSGLTYAINNRSWAFSVLKCEYGWNGCGTQDMRTDEIIEEALKRSGCPWNAAAKAAQKILHIGGPQYFRPRADGQPNRRIAQ